MKNPLQKAEQPFFVANLTNKKMAKILRKGPYM